MVKSSFLIVRLFEKWLTLLLIILFLFQLPIGLFIPKELLNKIDEVFLVLILLRIVDDIFLTAKIDKLFLFSSITFLALYSLSFFNFQPDRINAFLQVLIHLKLFYFVVWGNSFFRRYPDFGVKCIKIIFIIVLIFTTLNILFQYKYCRFIGLYVGQRFGFVRTFGPFNHPNLLAYYFCLMYVYYSYKEGVSREKFILYSLLFVVGVIFTGCRTAFLPLPIILFFKLKKDLNWQILIPVLGLVVILVSISFSSLMEIEEVNRTVQNIGELDNANDGNYIRAILYYNAFKLSNEFFPIGTGASTFGTVLSEGSEVYKYLGVDKKYYFVEMDGVYDSNIASILGEFGYLGLFMVMWLLYEMFKDYERNENVRFFKMSCAFIVGIFSFSNPVLMNSFNTLVLTLVFCVFLNKEFIRLNQG